MHQFPVLTITIPGLYKYELYLVDINSTSNTSYLEIKLLSLTDTQCGSLPFIVTNIKAI